MVAHQSYPAVIGRLLYQFAARIEQYVADVEYENEDMHLLWH